jgi:hypothetical protein
MGIVTRSRSPRRIESRLCDLPEPSDDLPFEKRDASLLQDTCADASWRPTSITRYAMLDMMSCEKRMAGMHKVIVFSKPSWQY